MCCLNLFRQNSNVGGQALIKIKVGGLVPCAPPVPPPMVVNLKINISQNI